MSDTMPTLDDIRCERPADNRHVETVQGTASSSTDWDAIPTAVEAADRLWQSLNTSRSTRELILDEQATAFADCYRHNIENYIGTVKVPVGLTGPLRIHGQYARGDFRIPLATTEATLVASYSRGAGVITAAGGCNAVVLEERLARSPGFAFRSLNEVTEFIDWIRDEHVALHRAIRTTTRHGCLVDMQAVAEGNHVYLNLEFMTGDAAGQNMVTFAADAILSHVVRCSPVKPRYAFLEANYSGDKKSSMRALHGARGKRVSAEITIPASVVEQNLNTSVDRMIDYWQMAALGGVLSGTVGVQGHFANGLAAMYIACGQDAACVAESAVGITRFEHAEEGGLYAAVTLPAVILGTVGGGTKLPSQSACLEILGLPEENGSRAFAEVCASLMLAGELSIIGALAEGGFARAHAKFARGRNLG